MGNLEAGSGVPSEIGKDEVKFFKEKINNLSEKPWENPQYPKAHAKRSFYTKDENLIRVDYTDLPGESEVKAHIYSTVTPITEQGQHPIIEEHEFKGSVPKEYEDGSSMRYTYELLEMDDEGEVTPLFPKDKNFETDKKGFHKVKQKTFQDLMILLHSLTPEDKIDTS